ncbi:DUF6711 family protein [Lachnospiraceae bacterium JLR.KK009]|nr:hypothetical protein C810_05238 [Lachnospiraceae bacterium A2]MCI8707876.1 hypothetical protein [Lachnospiraceae bacterium]MCI8883994.1 hypothetical protein [Lachnospiraceae bacterium]
MFDGWLIKFGNVVLPNSFILADGWESTPNQRVELDAYRDANVLLHRETSENFKTSLTLNIRSMDLAEMTAFKNVVGLATLEITSKRERRLAVTYWNDEELAYKNATMYMPDVTYSIHTVDESAKGIEYNPFSIELIEY